jgi:hypothetical protein
MSERLRFRDPVDPTGFTIMPNAVLRSPRLGAAAKVAYALLRDYARQERVAFPGRRAVCARIPTSPRTWHRSLKALVALGLVTVERRGLGKTNRYWIEPLTPELLARLGPLGSVVPGGPADPDLEKFFDDPFPQS